MSSIKERIERFAEEGSRRLSALSAHWQEHTNRRTILAAVFAGALILTLYVSAIQPPRNFPINALVTIEEGASLSQAAEQFAKTRVVRSARVLEFLMRLTGQDTSVHAGDYLFRKPENLFAVARAIAGGYFGLEPLRIRIPEGSTIDEMAYVFAAQLERFDEEHFLENAKNSEGYLYPDTYFFMPNTTDEQVLAAMRQNFDERLRTISKELVSFGRPLRDIVIIASLLEREANDFEDRRKIAGVLWNRLERNMALQVDAAFLYSIGRTTFELTTADLTNKNDEYNTYVHKGLPPGPIGSPSLDSLRAAVTPVQHDYLFYLADRSYVTHYSETYEEHLKKKELYLGG